jgi:drug/metabolite transporter (DMT)-like permease
LKQEGFSPAYQGIALILIATLAIVLMNTCAKKASAVHGPVEMVFYRGLVILTLLVPYMITTRSAELFKTRRLKVHLYRAAVGNLGVGLAFWAYALLPMADATALMFASPLFVTALSPLMLREMVDRFRWGAVVAGFGGILLIVKPSAALISNPASLIGLAAAFFVALVDIALRNLGRTEDPLTTVFYFILFGVLAAAPYSLLYGSPPAGKSLPWMVGIGLFAALQQVAKTTALRMAEASWLAPYTYTSILWATLIGWQLWGDFPDHFVVVGTAVVIASNLAIIWRK